MPKYSYAALLNMYNTCVTRIKEMEDDKKNKAIALKKYEAEMDVIIDHTRKLCEKILAKDRSEMVLGTSKSWASTGTLQLIDKATDSFDAYVVQTTKLLNDIHDVAEKRGQEIDNLKDQIATMLINGNVSATSVEEIVEEAEKNAKAKVAFDKSSAKLKQEASIGKVEVIYEDDDDFTSAEQELLDDMAGRAVATQLTPKSTPLVNSDAKVKALKRADNKAVQTHMIDLVQHASKCSDEEWEVLRAIGELGMSKALDITNSYNETVGLLSSTVQKASLTLINMGAILCTKVLLPNSGATNYYSLTDMGRRLYKHHFGKEAVKSEIEIVTAEHDNPEHGYGIMLVAEAFSKIKRFKSVSCNNRKKPIKIVIDGQNYEYIPDIVAVAHNHTEYYEYERNTHTQVGFNQKCDKMMRVTKYLNFIVPNRNIARQIKTKIEKWIETKEDNEIKNIRVRLATYNDAIEDKYGAEYVLSKSRKPDFFKY